MREVWKKYNLGEVAELKNGKSMPEKVGAYPVYGGNGILGYTDKFNVDPELGLVFEIDGSNHNDKQEYDQERDTFRFTGLSI